MKIISGVRRVHAIIIALLIFELALSAVAQTAPPGMAPIPAGTYRPLFRTNSGTNGVSVKPFYLDILPVSNGDFLEFVRLNPQWRRSSMKRIFADGPYLESWAGDLDPGSNAPLNVPVVDVSWYAARAFAQWKNKRLPSTAEWEYAASASPKNADGRSDSDFKRRVLEWYSSPAPAKLSPVGLNPPNFWGIHDMHGLVWEWVSDFNFASVSDDTQGAPGSQRESFCGAGAEGAADVDDYPAFMRSAFRSSLKRNYCLHQLGFRCARDF